MMMNWKVVGNIAAGSGIISVVFGVFSAILTFQLWNGVYQPNYVMLLVLTAMLNPFLLVAGIAFVTAWFAMHAGREEPELVVEEEVKPVVESEPEEKAP
jgi:hypothetical protein